MDEHRLKDVIIRHVAGHRIRDGGRLMAGLARILMAVPNLIVSVLSVHWNFSIKGKLGAESIGVLITTKAFGKLRTVLHRFELTL